MMLRQAWEVPMLKRAPEGDAGGTGGGGEGGDPGGGGSGGGTPDDKSKQQVPLATHKEVLDKFHAANGQLKTLAAEVETLKQAAKTRDTKTGEDKGDFKPLYETLKTEHETLKGTHEKFKQSVFNTARLTALEAELKKQGLKAGNESVVDFADLEKMPHETTSRGRILVHGVEEMAADLKKRYDFAFGKPANPKINSGGGNDGGGKGDDETDYSTLTAEYMVQLETKDNKKYRELYPHFVREMHKRRQA